MTNATGRLIYSSDAEGNRIPDFSHAGYRGGGVSLPSIQKVLEIGPISGDNTGHIQAAIDEVSRLTPNEDGFRGAALLRNGAYPVRGTIRVRANGVVLRGEGDGTDPTVDTIIRRIGNSSEPVIQLGGGSNTRWSAPLGRGRVNIVEPFVPVGATDFEVATPVGFEAGDAIVIVHPCTQAWLQAVEGGGTANDAPWIVDSQPLVFHRYITAIQNRRIHIDAPVFNHLNGQLSQTYIYRHDSTGFVYEVGLEDLRVEIETQGPLSENHAQSAVEFVQVENAWARGVTTSHFVQSGFILRTATRCTIKDCRALEPHSEITGSRRYNFNASPAQLALFENCLATEARHAYVGNGTSWDSGVVFLNCVSSGAFTSSEGHRRWGMGFLYDGHREVDVRQPGLRVLGLYNRGSYGTGHGWALAHSVAWRCDVGSGQLVVQKPPAAQNYAIGCFGQINGAGPFAQPTGHIEHTGKPNLRPESLYRKQLADRLERERMPLRFTSFEFVSDLLSVRIRNQDGSAPAVKRIRELKIKRALDIAAPIAKWIDVNSEFKILTDGSFEATFPITGSNHQSFFIAVSSFEIDG